MPTKYQNRLNQGTPKKIAPTKTSNNQNSPKENTNNHDNIKVTELLSWIASLEKTVDDLKEFQYKIICRIRRLSIISTASVYSC